MERQKNRKLPKRILAWIVCFAIVFSVLNVIPGGTMEVEAASADGAKIVAVAQSYIGKVQSVGRCLGFCRLVYREAGYNTTQDPNGCGSACAYHSWIASSHLGSTRKDNIPLGALVFFSGASSQSVLSCGARPGHVGIYVGDGYIINARGTVTNGTNIKKDKISLWESWGYTFLGWRPISGYTLDSGGSADNSFISYIERPASGENYSGSIGILGYALHKNGIRNVTAWVNGQVMGCSMYNSPDVAKVYPGYPTGNEGFQAQIPISCLKEGENEIDIYAYEKDDTPHLIASHKFNWNSFVGKLESPIQNGSYDGTLLIQGYALHKNGIRNVTAWVNGQVMDCPMYERSEIATKYLGYPTGNEGFKTEIPISCLKNGENEINVFAYESNDWPHNIASYKFNYVTENQDTPYDPSNPDNPDDPNDSDNLDQPDNPDNPDYSDNSENSDNSDKEPSTTYTYKLNDDKTTITIAKYTASDENIAIPSSIDGYAVTGIDEKAFQNISTMKTISFPASLKSIGNYAFAGCKSLTMVMLSDSLTELGNSAFWGCENLTSITIPESVIEIGNFVFEECPLTTIMGKKGSYAETYANENGYIFVDIGNADTGDDSVGDDNTGDNNNEDDSIGDLSFLAGDVDCNKEVNLNDATIVLRVAVGIQPQSSVTKQGQKNADYDKSGKIDLKDATYTLKTAVGIKFTLPKI